MLGISDRNLHIWDKEPVLLAELHGHALVPFEYKAVFPLILKARLFEKHGIDFRRFLKQPTSPLKNRIGFLRTTALHDLLERQPQLLWNGPPQQTRYVLDLLALVVHDIAMIRNGVTLGYLSDDFTAVKRHVVPGRIAKFRPQCKTVRARRKRKDKKVLQLFIAKMLLPALCMKKIAEQQRLPRIVFQFGDTDTLDDLNYIGKLPRIVEKIALRRPKGSATDNTLYSRAFGVMIQQLIVRLPQREQFLCHAHSPFP